MSWLGSLQARLMSAFVLVTVVAMALSALVFVLLTREEQQRAELDRVASTAPSIFTQFQRESVISAQDVSSQAERIAKQYDTRVVLVDSDNVVVEDSAGLLVGKKLEGVRPEASGPRGEGGYRTWSPPAGSPGAGTTFIASGLPRFGEIGRRPGGGPAGGPPPIDGYLLLLGVPKSSLSRAWLDTLPGLGIAAGAALPVAIVLAVLLARSISRPVAQLTTASQQVASGSYDVNIDTGRRDELGRLGRAFTEMTERVGATQSEMRGLIAGVSHDLKTPLTPILGFSRVLKDGAAPPEETARMAGIIHDEATRLGRRLEDLLYLSELESGEPVLAREPVDLGRLAGSVLDRLLENGLAAGVSVERRLASDVVVDGDPVRLERLAENLVDNARRYTPEGGILRVVVAPSGPATATLEVANSAPGLTAEEVPGLFRRFHRRDRSRSSGGTGLGLSIARELAELHGGRLDAALEGDLLVMRVRLPAAAPLR